MGNVKKNLRAIHETELLDIITTFAEPMADVIDTAKSGSGSRDIRYASSLAKATSAMTLVFPVMVSDTIQPKTAMMITKAIERKCVTMMQIALSAFGMSNAGNVADFLKDFHTNVDARKMDLDRYMDIAMSIADSGLLEGVSPIDYRTIAAINEDCRRNLNYVLGENFSDRSLEDFQIRRNGLKDIITEARKSDFPNEADPEEQRYQRGLADKDFEYERNKADKEADKLEDLMDTAGKSQITSSDTKKANELAPSLLTVRILLKDPSEGKMQSREAVIGIKAKMYATDADSICNKIVTKHVDSNIMLKLVKVGTREISFFKDFIFAIDKAKIDAITKSKRGSANKLFKVLERRALGGKVRKALGLANTCKPIFSLVITKEEADWLYSNKDVDVQRESVVIPIMEALNLMYFCIVDSASETVQFLLDGDSQYETLTFGSLEKETNDKQFNQLVNLISQINR